MLRLVVLATALCACRDRTVPAPPPCADVKGCRHLAHELEEAGDIAGASAAYIRGCDQRDGVSCYDVARLALEADASLRDVGRAQTFAERACELGIGDACNDASAHLTPMGASSPRGVALLDKGCRLGSGVSCYNLGIQHRMGWGGLRADLAVAGELLAKACERDHANACADLGLFAMLGRGIPEDRPRAVTLLERACKLEVRTCGHLATAYEDGMGVSEDLARARVLYDQACGAGDQEACSALARIRAEN